MNLSSIIEQTTVDNAIKEFKKLLIHAFIISQENKWIFISQIEAYYHDKNIDDVSQVDDKDEYPEKITVSIEKFQEGRGSWYELRFRYQKIEIIATGGLYNSNANNDDLRAFLGVAAPPSMASDSKFILFSPAKPAETVSCVRMLRNYKKKCKP